VRRFAKKLWAVQANVASLEAKTQTTVALAIQEGSQGLRGLTRPPATQTGTVV
jgi:hypothetical protein